MPPVREIPDQPLVHPARTALKMTVVNSISGLLWRFQFFTYADSTSVLNKLILTQKHNPDDSYILSFKVFKLFAYQKAFTGSVISEYNV